MQDKQERNSVEFRIPEGLLPYQGIAVVASLGEENEQILNVITYGNVPTATRMGLLQVALDRERERMRRAWGETR